MKPEVYFKEMMQAILFWDMTDKLVSVRVIVVKVSTLKPFVMQMNLDCAQCKSNIDRIFPDGKVSPPSFVSWMGVKETFTIRTTAEATDSQKIR